MYRIVLAGLLPALFAAPAAAQVGGVPQRTPRGDARIVTEAEFLSALDDSHPAVAESSEALALARAGIMAAATRENPMFAVVREDPDGPVEQVDWTLSWQLPGAGRRPRIAAREEAADATAARLQQQLLSLRLRMREVYADWAFASARHERLAGQAERVEALAEREILRAERGEASGLEARRLELAAGSLWARVALAAAAAEQARARAAGWSVLPPDARPVLPMLPAAPEPGGRADGARSSGRASGALSSKSHPLVRAAERELAAATLERQAARRFVRSPEVSLGWQRQEAGHESIDGPVLGLAWSVPVFARNRAEKAASEARVSGARARLERVRRELESARAGNRESFQHLAEAFGDAAAALGGNERMLEGAEAAFRHGEASLTDLLETYRSVTESELAVLDLHQAALAAHRELERVAGTSSPERPGPREPDPDSKPDNQENLP